MVSDGDLLLIKFPNEMLGMAINIQSVRFLDDDTTALHRARTFLSLAAQLWLFLVL